MPIFNNNILAGAAGSGGAAGYQIEQSLRFNSEDSSRLSISPSSTNRKTWTWSSWVKRSKLGGYDRLFGAETSSTAITTVRFTALAGYEDCLEFHHNDGTNVSTVTTAAKLRDLSAWYHITVVVDTSQVIPANRTKIYINGIKQELSSTSYLNQDVLTFVNSGNTTNIGRSGYYGAYFDGYLAEVNFLDGLTPGTATDDNSGSVSGIPNAEYLTDFGEFDNNGVWQPIEYTGSYPGNSFYLKFDDTSSTTSIGKDSSGNGNDFTATNITVLGLPAPESDEITGVSQYTAPTYSDSNNFTSTGTTSFTPSASQREGLFGVAERNGISSYDPNQTIVWAPSTGIPCTKLELVIYDGQKSTGPMAVNGTYDIRPYVAVSSTGFNYVNIPSPPSTLTSITFSGGTGGVGWYGIRVNGVKLIDNDTVATLTLASNKDLAKFNAGDTVRQNNGVDYLAGTTVENGAVTTSLYDGLVDTNTSTFIRPTTDMYFSNLPQASTSLRIYCWAQTGNLGNMIINGSDSGVSSGSGSSWGWVTLNSLCPITMTSLSTASGNLADGLFISAIEIDGSIVRSPSIGGNAAAIDTSANTITVNQSAGTWSANTSNYVVGPSTLNTSEDLDCLVDSPTNGDPADDTGLGGELAGNYCTLNPLDNYYTTLSNGNLTLVGSPSIASSSLSTFFVSSGKWYWEATFSNVSGAEWGAIGVGQTAGIPGASNSYVYKISGTKVNNNSSSSYGDAWSTGDVIGVAFDCDARSITFYRNGVSQGVAFSGMSAGSYSPQVGETGGGAYSTADLNFGQRPFAYQNAGVDRPSADYKCLCTANLPDPDIADGSTAMDVVTGNFDTTKTWTLDFNPDLIWIKSRSNSDSHVLTDSVRGKNSQLFSDTTQVEATNTNAVTAFNTDGFTIGNYGLVSNTSTVAWTWNAGGQPTTDNVAGAGNVPTAGSAKINGANMTTSLAGSIPATRLSANTAAGFSIVSYTGNGINNATVAHGLNESPQMVIVKNRDDSLGEWPVYHTSLTPNNVIWLNYPNGQGPIASRERGAVSSTSSSTFTCTQGSVSSVNVNENGDNYVAYCFAPVESYSSFGLYQGNSSPDGPFVACNFRPKYVMVKAIGATRDWMVWDAARVAYNVNDTTLSPNKPAGDLSPGYMVDFVSNGFKLRASTMETNNSAYTYLYCAFAENPFKYARAR